MYGFVKNSILSLFKTILWALTVYENHWLVLTEEIKYAIIKKQSEFISGFFISGLNTSFPDKEDREEILNDN